VTQGEHKNQLERAAAEVASAVTASKEPKPDSVRDLRRGLLRRARGYTRSLTEAEEAVDAVLESFIRAAVDHRVDVETAGAYVARSLQHQLTDAFRRTRTASGESRTVPLDTDAMLARHAEDEALARLFEAAAARSDVLRALQAAADKERFTVVRVVAQWLVLAERTQEEPSSREVADALGLSHTAVNDALREFRDQHLPKDQSGA
jgi:DNA-directed RNA polymerase specialized sigma24 family protein